MHKLLVLADTLLRQNQLWGPEPTPSRSQMRPRMSAALRGLATVLDNSAIGTAPAIRLG